MVLTAGILSLLSSGPNNVNLTSTSAIGGTPPYTQQWYRDTASPSFTPGPSNIIAGATNLTLNDTNLISNVTYYYKVVYTDATTATVTSSAFTYTAPAPSQEINSFAQKPLVGEVDLQLGTTNIISCVVAQEQSTPLYGGSRVYALDNDTGIPTVSSVFQVVPRFLGYITYDVKSRQYNAGNLCEVAQNGTAIWLFATTPIARMAKVCIDQFVQNGVQALSSTGLNVIGYAYDKAEKYGDLIRVILSTPSSELDT